MAVLQPESWHLCVWLEVLSDHLLYHLRAAAQHALVSLCMAAVGELTLVLHLLPHPQFV